MLHPTHSRMNTAPMLRPVGLFVLALLARQAAGQDPTPTHRLEEIVVTATRIERSLQQVPGAASVVVVDEAAIQLGRQQLALDESLSRVPGVFMQNRYNFAQDLRVSIRGFGARANFGIRGVKILVDGIPETLPDGQGQVDSIDLGAAQQIEVLRGPSSSMYGNASGGVIAVTSEAGPADPYAELRMAGGAWDYQKLQLKAGGQTDSADYFVSLSDTRLDGFRAQSEAVNTQLTGRARFDLGDDRSLVTVVNFTDQPISDDAGALTAADAATNPDAAWPANVTFDAGEALQQSRVGIVYTMPLGEGHELAARSYYVSRSFDNALPFQDSGIVKLERAFAGGSFSYSYDGQLFGLPNRLITGFDIDDQDDDRQRFDNLFGVAGTLRLDQNERVLSRGLFFQDELSVSEELQLTFGIRLDEVRFDVTDNFLSDGDDSGSRTLENTNPMLGGVYALTPSLSLYANYSTAFETPTTTEFNRPDGGGGFNPALEPQLAANVELGLRGSFGLENWYEIALFQIDVEDELIPFEVQGSPGRVYYENAGESRRKGLEFSVTAHPIARVAATVSYTYSDFNFTEFTTDAGVDYSGNTLPGTVEHLLFGELNYTHPSGWYGAVDALYVDDQFADNANTATNPSYTLMTLRVGLERDVGAFHIGPFLGVNNLLDETYNANVRINAFGSRYFEPGPERHVYAGVALRRQFR
jgi:iron complex outermembrane receptor protein